MNKIEFKGYSKSLSKGIQLLRNVNLKIESGKVTALVGISGEGKSTLMESIVGMCEPEQVTKGEIFVEVNGKMQIRDPEKWIGRVAYVEQFAPDYKHIPLKVVLDSIARIQGRPSTVVDELIAKLRMEKTVFTPFKNLSGGEKKRAMLISGLLNNRELNVWDEPLTGLDTETARIVLKLLKQEGKTYLISIHQLMEDFAKMIDNAVVLCQSTVIYYGPLSEMVPFFTSRGVVFPQDAFYLNYITRMCANSEAENETDAKNLEIFRNIVQEKIDYKVEYSKEELEAKAKSQVQRNVFLVRPRHPSRVAILEIYRRSLYFDRWFRGSGIIMEIVLLVFLVGGAAYMMKEISQTIALPSKKELKDMMSASGGVDERLVKIVETFLGLFFMKCIGAPMLILGMAFLVNSETNGLIPEYYKLCAQNIRSNQFTASDYYFANILEIFVRSALVPFLCNLVLIYAGKTLLFKGWTEGSVLGTWSIILCISMGFVSMFTHCFMVRMLGMGSKLKKILVAAGYGIVLLVLNLFTFLIPPFFFFAPFNVMYLNSAKDLRDSFEKFATKSELLLSLFEYLFLCFFCFASFCPSFIPFEFALGWVMYKENDTKFLSKDLITAVYSFLSAKTLMGSTNNPQIKRDPLFRAIVELDHALILKNEYAEILRDQQTTPIPPQLSFFLLLLLSFGIFSALMSSISLTWYRRLQPKLR